MRVAHSSRESGTDDDDEDELEADLLDPLTTIRILLVGQSLEDDSLGIV